MKILRVIPSMNPALGGPTQGIRNSIPALLRHGIYNEIVCFDDPNEKFLGTDPFPINTLGNSTGVWSFHSDLKSWLAANLKRFDCVIIHGLWLYHSYATWQAIREYRVLNPDSDIKVYLMPHGMLDPWFQNTVGRRLKAVRNWLYWKLIESRVINGVDGILFTCEQELLLARQTFHPYHPKREINVGYGIASPPKHSPEMDIAFSSFYSDLGKVPYILFLSRIHEKKGVELLIEAYLQLKKELVKLPKLIVAGPGLESRYGQSLLELTEGDRDVIFTGMLTGDSKWGALYNCEAFVLPSFQENFGIAVVEALACARPVLISDQVNIWSEIIEGKGGWVLDGLNVESIKTSLLSITQLNYKEKETYRSNALRVFQDKFNVEEQSQVFAQKLLAFKTSNT